MTSMGKLIVFEGLVDSLLQSHAETLEARLKKQGTPAFLTQEPSRGPLGNQIRLIIQGFLNVTDPAALAVYLAADRCDHLRHDHGILRRIEQGEIVICCRYALSSYAAYGFAEKGIDLDWLRAINQPFRRP